MKIKQKILIVEDDAQNIALYKAIFWENEMEIFYAQDAPEGLQLAGEHKPDLIVMDLGLPNIDGLEATRRLKRNQVTREIPVLLVTAHIVTDDEAKAAGCLEVVRKPIKLTRFRSTIEEIVIKANAEGDQYGYE